MLCTYYLSFVDFPCLNWGLFVPDRRIGGIALASVAALTTYSAGAQTTPRAAGACNISRDSVSTAGDQEHGISLVNGGDSTDGVYRVCAGSIGTTGDAAHGVYVNTFNQNIAIDVRGPITATGELSSGIRIENSVAQGVKHTSIRAHDITTNPGDSEFSNHAIYVETPGMIETEITGHLRTSGDRASGLTLIQFNPENGRSSGKIDVSITDLTTDGEIGNGVNILTVNGESDVNVMVLGHVLIKGPSSRGIAVESTGSDIKVTIGKDGSITALGKDSYPLSLVGTVDPPGINKSAVIDNQGTVRGNIQTEGCAYFDNSGRFEMGDKIFLSTAPCESDAKRGLHNRGILSAGKASSIATSRLSGQTEDLPTLLTQASNGILLVDVDWVKANADMIEVIGKVELNGTLEVNSLSFPGLAKVNFFSRNELGKVSFLMASDGISGKVQPLQKGLFLVFDVSKTKGDEGDALSLSLSTAGVNFLNRNQSNVFKEMQNSLANSQISSEFDELLAMEEIPAIRYRLDGFGNEIAGAVLRSSVLALSGEGPASEACRWTSIGKDHPAARGKRLCIGLFPDRTRLNVAANDEQRRFDERQLGLAITAGSRLGDSPAWWKLTLDTRKTDIGLETLAKADGWLANMEGGGGINAGPFGFALNAGFARGKGSSERHVMFDGRKHSATADYVLNGLSLSGRVDHRAVFGATEVLSFAKMTGDRIQRPAYKESGAGQFSLVVDPVEETFATYSIGTGLQHTLDLSDNLKLRPRVGISWSERETNEFRVTSAFSGGTGRFESLTQLPDRETSVTAGISAVSLDGRLSLDVSLDHQSGSGTGFAQDTVRAGLHFRF